LEPAGPDGVAAPPNASAAIQVQLILKGGTTMLRIRLRGFVAAFAGLCLADLGATAAASTVQQFRYGINLTRVFDSPNSRFADWNRQISEQDLARLRQIGFDFIRLPVDPAPLLKRSVSERQADLDQVIAFSNLAVRLGFSVVVDLHFDFWQTGPNSVLDTVGGAKFMPYETLVVQLAQRLAKGDVEHVALELMNEPQAVCSIAPGQGTDWTLFQQELYRSVRGQVGKELKLVVTPSGYSVTCLEGFDPRTRRPYKFDLTPFMSGGVLDRNLYATIHFYEPFIFTHQGINNFAAVPYPTPEDMTQIEPSIRSTNEKISEKYPQKAQQDLATTRDFSEKTLRYYVFGNTFWHNEPSVRQLLASGKLPPNQPGTSYAIKARINPTAAWADAVHIARDHVFFGEFGVDIFAHVGRDAWLHDVSTAISSFGFGWAVWAYDAPGAPGGLGQFSIVDSSNAIPRSTVQALFGAGN
jgi:endoglucanase